MKNLVFLDQRVNQLTVNMNKILLQVFLLHFDHADQWILLDQMFFLAAFTTTATEANMIKDSKVIVSLSQLQQLIPTRCVSRGCDATLSATEKFRGCGVVIYLKCSKGHTFTWSSSPQHHDKRGQSIHSNNLLLAAACLISGNSYAKIELFCRFMGLKVISEAMYYRYKVIYRRSGYFRR